MKIIMIRHGKTAGNLEGRYIGRKTDEPLCAKGVEEAQNCQVPVVKKVYASPLKRCVETAEILYPGQPLQLVENFKECDFGDFEGLNYPELNGREDYQKWIDSNGELPFPNGESRTAFAQRCVSAFEKIREEEKEDCALIVHGGTIMAIMEKYARPQGNYFDFQVKNGHGYILFENGTYSSI